MIKSKKIIISVLTLILTVAALGATTFAWFSLSTVSNISNISGEVRGAEGLEVRLAKADGTSATPWRSHLNSGDVTTFIANTLTDGKLEFEAVTLQKNTDGDFKDFKKMNHKTAVVNSETAVVNVDYLEFVIQFKSPNNGVVTLDDFTLQGSGVEGKTTFKSDNKYYQFDASNLDNEEIWVDPSNGARFSLEVAKGEAVTGKGYLAYQKEDSNGYEQPFKNGVDGEKEDYYVGNTANNAPVQFGQYSFLTDAKRMILYYDDINTSITVAGGDDQQKLDTIDMMAAQQSATDGTKFTLVQNDSLTAPFTNADDSDHVGELTIRIWLEGWDPDTYDALYDGLLELFLVFSKELED